MNPNSPLALRQQLAGAPAASVRYKALADFVLLHPKFVATLASVIDVKLYDELQDCLTSLCRPLEALEVIKSLLRSEFERKALKEPGSILRGASLAAKMSSKHSRAVGSEYMCALFKDWIEEVKSLHELNVEVPEDKNKLIAITNSVIELMSRDDKVAAIPFDIREMARLISSLCDIYLPDQKWPLVGGLVLLRLYSPTLISPTTYGLLPVDYPLSAGLRKNLMQVTRLLQNASNHQPFKDGPNMALNEWVEKAGDAIDKFLEKIVSSEGVASAPAPVNGARETNDAMVLKFVQLFVQHKAKMGLELDGCSEEFKPVVRKFDDLLGACGNPFRTRTGTVAKASEALSLSLGGLASKRAQDQSAFALLLQNYRWPAAYLKDYLAAPSPRPRDKTIFLCGLISNDKDGVPCAPKVGKKENHLVFVGRDGVDWIMEHLGLTERETQCVVMLQEMCDLELIVPWQTEKKEKKSGVKYEDSDRFFWFDYAAIIRQKGGASLESARKPSPPPVPSSADERDMHKVLESVQLEKLAKAGVLESAAAGIVVEAASIREQWRMLLLIAYNMFFSPFPIKGSQESLGDKTFFEMSDADAWCKRFLHTNLPAHSAELLGNLQNDGFVFEKDNKWGANFQKIKQWHEKTMGSRASTSDVATPQLPPRPNSTSKMSLRGKMGTSRSSMSMAPESPKEGDAPTLLSSSRESSGRTLRGSSSNASSSSLATSNSAVPSVSSVASGNDTLSRSSASTAAPTSARRTIPAMEKTMSESSVIRTTVPTKPSKPAPADDESSGEREDDGGDVSMLDFLNMDQESDKDKKPAAKTSKLKGLFSKKEKSEPKLSRGKSAGLFGRKKDE